MAGDHGLYHILRAYFCRGEVPPNFAYSTVVVNVAFSPRLWHLRVSCAGLNGAYHILTVLVGKRAMTLPWKGRNRKEIFFSLIFGSPVSHTLGIKRQTYIK